MMIDSSLPLFAGLSLGLAFFNLKSHIAIVAVSTILLTEKTVPYFGFDFYHSMTLYTLVFLVASAHLAYASRKDGNCILIIASILYVIMALTPIMSLIQYNPISRFGDLWFYSNWSSISRAENLVLFILAILNTKRASYDKLRVFSAINDHSVSIGSSDFSHSKKHIASEDEK